MASIRVKVLGILRCDRVQDEVFSSYLRRQDKGSVYCEGLTWELHGTKDLCTSIGIGCRDIIYMLGHGGRGY